MRRWICFWVTVLSVFMIMGYVLQDGKTLEMRKGAYVVFTHRIHTDSTLDTLGWIDSTGIHMRGGWFDSLFAPLAGIADTAYYSWFVNPDSILDSVTFTTDTIRFWRSGSQIGKLELRKVDSSGYSCYSDSANYSDSCFYADTAGSAKYADSALFSYSSEYSDSAAYSDSSLYADSAAWAGLLDGYNEDYFRDTNDVWRDSVHAYQEATDSLATPKAIIDYLEVDDSLKAKVGRGATYTVAASNSNWLSKLQADWVCDGTDDQVEINAAIDSLPANGGSVILFEGEYDITNDIVLYGNVDLSGMGYGTYLNSDQTSGQVIYANGSDETYKENVSISDLRITGAEGGAFGIRFRYCKNSNIHNVWIENTGQENIYLGYSSHCIVKDNHISGGWKDTDGIKLLMQCHNNIISNNNIKNMGILGSSPYTSDGIEIQDSCYYNTIIGNTIDSCMEFGINLERSVKYNSVLGNTIKNIHGVGIVVIGGSMYNTISENTAQGLTAGIEIWSGCDNNIISNNICSATATQKGIWVNGASYLSIVGNNMNSARYGIYAASMKHSNVNSNILQDTTGAGLWCGMFFVGSDSNMIAANYIYGSGYEINFDSTSDYNIVLGAHSRHVQIKDYGTKNTYAFYYATDTMRINSSLPIKINDVLILNKTSGIAKFRGILNLPLGYHLGGDSVVIETGDTIASPTTGMEFVDTSGGDTTKQYLNSAWEVK